MYIFHDKTIWFLGLYPVDLSTYILYDVYGSLFTATLFVTTKYWKQVNDQ